MAITSHPEVILLSNMQVSVCHMPYILVFYHEVAQHTDSGPLAS